MQRLANQGFRSGVAAAVLLAIVGWSSSGLAGDKLQLKTGTVDTKAIEGRMKAIRPSNQPAYFVVQFKQAIRDEDRRNVATLGAKIVRYLPDDALVVRATAKDALNLRRSSPNVHAVVPFDSSWKTSPEFTPSSVFSARTLEEVLVRLFPQENEAQALAALRAINGVQILNPSGRSIIARATRPAIDEMAFVTGVEWIQPNPQFESMHFRDNSAPEAFADGDYSDLTGFEAGTKLMNFDQAWARGLTGRGQIVSMADTGLDLGDPATIHQDFSARIPTGFTFGLYAKGWEDPMGHGTHVAGSVLGSGAASGGKLRGGAYDAQMVPQGMWSPMLGNLTVPPRLADLFTKAYGAGARIHTNSWGSPRNLGSYDSFSQQADEYMAAHPDMLLIFAAGNSGLDTSKDGRVDADSISSPGTAKNVLTVGASKNYILKGGMQKKLKETRLAESFSVEPLASSMMSENAQGIAGFSSRGPTDDGRLKPEVVAPGTNILSNKSRHKDAELLWGAYNSDYVWSGGTSMATPLTAGAAAVVRQYLVEQKNLTPSAAVIKAVLMHTAFDLFPGQFGEVGAARGQELLTRRPNMDEGYGRVDVAAATDLASAMIIDESKGLATGEAHRYAVSVGGSAKLTATLVYTDAPAAVNAAKALVNDLDLVLVDAGGKETSINDHVNNSEMIQADVASGSYEIRIKGANVPQGITGGKQPYALIVTVK